MKHTYGFTFLRYFCLTSFLIYSLSFFGQESELPPLPKSFEKEMELRTIALGSFSLQISSKVDQVQAYFDQGIQLKYAFAVNDAARSFREAWKRDSTCAICYWGEAWALGAYLNGKLTKKKSPHALAAIQKAAKYAKKYASSVEKALIKAMKVRYVEDFDPDKAPLQDTAYAKAMQKVYEKYPGDLDVATIYAEALFVLEPRRGTRDLNDPDVIRIHQVLEKVLEKDIQHPGACHLYIHATESTQKPEKALPCIEFMGDAVPGASHLNHMPSHTYNELGMWPEAVKANLQAWHSDQKAKIGEGFAIYPHHNLHMLLFAACYDGQGAIAIQAGKDLAKMGSNNMYHALTLMRFGRFDEVLNLTEKPKGTYPGAVWDFVRGYAYLKTGEVDFAQLYLERVKVVADTTEAEFREHKVSQLLKIAALTLEGEINWQMDKKEEAQKLFVEAVVQEDSLRWDEPEPMPFDARHWLGALLLEMEKYSEAEQVYRTELADHPNNGWSLFGLVKALEGQGKDASTAKKEFDKCWARSDIWLKASRF
ncbi:MAG: hypothetical protein AAF696_16675 [Bacteroidota bacterium]